MQDKKDHRTIVYCRSRVSISSLASNLSKLGVSRRRSSGYYAEEGVDLIAAERSSSNSPTNGGEG